MTRDRRLKVVEGYWDCNYCGTKRISGSTRACPNCSHPIGDNQKFYISINEALNKEALDEAEIPKGPHWQCAYCGSYNNIDSQTCSFCGSARNEGVSYFEATENRTTQGKKIKEETNYAYETHQSSGLLKKLIIAFMVIVGIVLIFNTLPKTNTLAEKSWRRSIDVEEYKTVLDSAWYLPKDATLDHAKEEIAGYNHVFSHYEQIPVQYSREVYAGDQCEEYTVDNGNGTFDVREVCSPVYTTEYYTVMESKPVYKDEPYYETKYYFYIDRWMQIDTLENEGVNDTPTWPEYDLKENQRFNNKTEQYWLTFKQKALFVTTTKKFKGNYDQYNDMQLGKSYSLSVNGLSIKSYTEK